MINRFKSFIKTALLGGLIVILPVAVLLFVFTWVFDLITGVIQPLTTLIAARAHIREVIADVLVISIILMVCFTVGVIVRTKIGKFVHEGLENRILRIAPGYSMVKEIVVQFFGSEKAAFSSVVLVKIFESDALMTAFVTDTHTDGSYTVFIPTGPNPTSGNIFHLKEEHVHHIDVKVEDAMKSIISCGAGSTTLIDSYINGCKNRIGHR